MTPADLLDQGVRVAFAFFALGILLAFSFGLLLGFVGWMRSFLG